MAIIDERDILTLIITRLVAEVDATARVLAPHEAAPPGDPTHADYQASWCKVHHIEAQPAPRHYHASEQAASRILVRVTVACSPRTTMAAPLAVETLMHTIKLALSDWHGTSSGLHVTLEQPVIAINAEPDPETTFMTGLLTVGGIAETA